ncbi:hypothetical protein LRP31_22140 [Mesorhizobium mediterraneum]|uniref:Multi-ubiquitin domain-containing protein n=1 Tax=Mesorhizobium mediterraneum TaxID=43617 RepID=A0AB36R2Y1_9HYPH|nr:MULTISPECIES: hypothetical protein [Mesorhizobium]PAP98745.1 hypothetical protein CIT25_28760 [Mesorhizobium mediterraneum]RUU27002.1 hypothetical protein EOC94_24530 [Mesorhizobium sp. M6A.T.Ce.TU.016.01.1.1]RUU41546.1 hypothetical protein EOC93_19765 [Mesorhizobium sp. M6A.T.Ce.TU.002.03.1.1]RUU97077.1 hypothetical protein EOB36_28065 [Mesorhizobium sp. M6A.T.Cr.TU.017.01.1.1]RWN28814.1 MAG: hypothetical protein EOR95_22530 [Mesorhizobium sp.]
MAKSPKTIAEENMKGWTAIDEIPIDSTSLPKVDGVGADLDHLKVKYFGQGKPRGSDAGAGRVRDPNESDDAALVVMERQGEHDFAPGRKTVIVRGNKVVGTQG